MSLRGEPHLPHTSLDAAHLAASMAPYAHPALVLAWTLAALVGVTVIALVVAPWTQAATGKGRVVAYVPVERQQTIQSPIDGRVVRWHVIEGSRVKAGDPIVDLSDVDPLALNRLDEERTALEARITAARTRLAAVGSRRTALEGSRKNGLVSARQRAEMANERLRAAEQAVTAAEAADLTAQLNVTRIRALAEDGLRSSRDLELAQLDGVRARTDVDRSRASLAAARAEAGALRSDFDKFGTDASASVDDSSATHASAQAEIASANAELARLQVRQSRQSAQAVKAPRDGTIMRLLANNESEILKSGTPLAILVPDTTSRAVELWVDGNDAPLIAAGRHVRLQFEGWPAVQFTGWPSVAVGTFGGMVSLVDSHDNGAGKFRVLVVPDGSEPWPSGVFLRQGTRANGWVLLNRVRLGYELWRQFNGFPPVVATDEASALMKTQGGGK